ncbi:MAG: hypothetical protein RBS72_07620 [Sedimentisphaerales bacterium]|jgi:hypothetical protein|nr:hypothetical protein [Sedimentisphaerales bacterium]HNY79938.1 hypothetical protein [Sedimentisphaerales bacterium]HOC64878.1 hypothetical protein [Sedimentisphaerales bacterium]HOH64964.1 hypothetical protein [Sedimentisphaerales bacterium]HPY50317.1 hypothetical protein [Sedimentisphaerales bacterium]
MTPNLMFNGFPAFPFWMILFSFAFVLLIVLVNKTPKVGTWIVAGLLVLVPFAFLFLNASRHLPAIVPAFPFVMILCSFAFVLLILLFQKTPKLGAFVFVAILAMGAVAFFAPLRLEPLRHAVTQRATGHSVESSAQVSPIAPIAPREPAAPVLGQSPIWSEGIEAEFQADIYPSILSAARALGSRMERPVRILSVQGQLPEKIVIFRNELDPELAAAFQGALQEALKDIPCAVDANPRNLEPNEVGIMLRFSGRPGRPVGHDEPLDGSLEATAFANRQASTVNVSFSDKPWLEDFSRYVSKRPDRQVVVARSQEACTDENEARQQAIQDACNQLSAVAGTKWEPIPGRSPLTVSSQDVQEGGFILDQFVQSFDGSAGKIWRHAMLIDASAEKLAWLQSRKAAEVHGERVTWARMILSALGVLIVIVVTYLFLNMATKGYYEWTLRIAGTVLAIAGIIAIFLVLR